MFPEGGSHDRTDFLPLKAGFSLMALGAMAAHPDLKVQLVPVGLSYFHPHKFRSRAVIEFGAPIIADQSLVEMYKAGGGKKREACGKLLEQVHDGLRAVTLRGPDWETMQVIQAARRLYRIPGQHLTLGQVIELNKRFMEGYLHYQHEPKIIELRTRVLAYNRLLRDMGIADHQVERASNKSVKSGLLLIYRTGLLLWWGMLSLPGVILHAPVFILAKTISHQKAKGASVHMIQLTSRSSCSINSQDSRKRCSGNLEGPCLARRRSSTLCHLRSHRYDIRLPSRYPTRV